VIVIRIPITPSLKTNAKPPRAPLMTKVTAFAARNCADRKIAGGSIGVVAAPFGHGVRSAQPR
jgi:hypothetical protein